MFKGAAGIAFGLLSLHFWSFLPEHNALVTALILGGVVCAYFRWQLLIWVAFGALMANIAATAYLKNVQIVSVLQENITITGEVSSLLNHNSAEPLFEFIVSKHDRFPSPVPEQIRLQLRWQVGTSVPMMRQGERWQLDVKLRPPYGRVNSAGFDRERHFVGKNIHGAGIVLRGQRLRGSDGTLTGLRQAYFDQALEQTATLIHQPYLMALGFGYRGLLDDSDWSVLRDSGLAHLMAISGLHIGLAVMAGWGVGGFIRVLFGDRSRWQWLPLWAAFSLGLGYAWLAGFSLPTLRALLMSVLMLLLLRLRIKWASWQILLVVFAISLMMNPLVSYRAGFWLSFAAVLIILLASIGGVRTSQSGKDDVSWYARFRHKLSILAYMQLALLFLMLPVQWLWFGGFTPLAPVINFIAVPWVSGLTVPLVLAAVVFSGWHPVAMGLWQLADWTLLPVVWIANVATGSWLTLAVSWQFYLIAFAIITCLIWLLPFRPFKGFWAVVLLVVISWDGSRGMGSIMRPDNNEQDFTSWQVDMLDVGHGLAVVISRNGKAVLYDTGDAWPTGSIASSVIEPVLHQRGIHQLDGLILSHADNDHAGGAAYLISRFQPQWKRSSDVRSDFDVCIRDEKWQWQGLDFRVLWPPKQVKRAANPHSCVIQIQPSSNQNSAMPSLLLTGDIDAISELLLARLEPSLSPDIVLVPHHGSATSSTVTWLESINPKYGLVSVARYSPWKLPSPSVRQRYRDHNINWLSTASDGQVSLQIDARSISVTRYRQDVQAAWFRPIDDTK
ncbi:DNA internalization-related competence protein ComEC/Rec2 [Photobacterium nomapromontoriensis]|uniref:DNA internalization-related competence protein ComEC/Rec2 n=1 Tax=Photobacterium nomapromontoriensis TaxID=2910237 RepID=UPI003D0F4AD8